jgi:hypothetical protein
MTAAAIALEAESTLLPAFAVARCSWKSQPKLFAAAAPPIDEG